jgi:hypothetical protein
MKISMEWLLYFNQYHQFNERIFNPSKTIELVLIFLVIYCIILFIKQWSNIIKFPHADTLHNNLNAVLNSGSTFHLAPIVMLFPFFLLQPFIKIIYFCINKLNIYYLHLRKWIVTYHIDFLIKITSNHQIFKYNWNLFHI